MNYILEQLEYDCIDEDFKIPQSCNSFYKQSLYLSEYAHKKFNELLEDVGVSELKYFETTGSRVVYEGANLQSIKEKFESTLSKIYGSIDQFWRNALADFASDEKSLYKPIKQSTLDQLNSEKLYATIHSYFKEEDVQFGDNANHFIRSVNNTFYTLLIDHNAYLSDIKDASKKFEDVLCTKVSGIDDVKTSKEVATQLKEKLTGHKIEVTKELLDNYCDIMYKIAVSKESFQRAERAYQDHKKVFWEIVDRIEKDFNDKFLETTMEWTNIIIDTISILNICYGVQCDVMKRRRQEYRNVIATLNSIQNKIDKSTE